MDKNITKQLRVIGKPIEIAEFEQAITPYNEFDEMQEPDVRKIIQTVVDERCPNLTVLYSGNTVYGIKKLVADLKRVVRADDMNLLTDRLYKFFSLACGSIAHYNKLGWIDTYPTVDALRRFFRCNEFGQSVLSCQSHWATDRLAVVKEMNKVLKVKE